MRQAGRIAVLLLLCTVLPGLAARSGAPRSRPALVRCRGGYVRSNGPFRLPPELAPQRKPESTDSDDKQMSDAEKVYVLQQFDRPAIRKDFLRKVYGVVFSQVAATVLVVAGLRSSPMAALNLLGKLGPALFLLPLLPFYWLVFSSSARHTEPLNYLLLAAFTIFEGLALGMATLGLPTALVLRAAGTAAVAVGGLTAYALQTRRDFTAKGGMLFSGLLILLFSGLLQVLFGGSWIGTARNGFAALLFSAYLVYNTQTMMGGGKKHQVRPDEWLMAALNIYVDIINLFLTILQSMTEREQRR